MDHIPRSPQITAGDAVLEQFHPAVRAWFSRQFPGGPTPPQTAAWPHIATGRSVLVASPTGTGKTLTGFLVAIDAAYRAHAGTGTLPPGPSVLYVSPLRALAVDVHENLQVPLAGIRSAAAELSLPAPEITVGVRTGDTPQAERAAMRKHPPDLLVTTPESLYLLLTASSSRAALAHVRTVVVDEVHTLAKDKRGAHLALSLERLDNLVSLPGGSLQRIGLSATQRPLEAVARLLGGRREDRDAPVIVDCGHRRDLDVAIELPDSELEAVSSHVQLGQILDRMAELVRRHRTTLVFVNTRKLAERIAYLLSERLGLPDAPAVLLGSGAAGSEPDDHGAALLVAAHHGSLSARRRRIVEERLRAGDLRALVATASLELGIDVGPVDLVCQIGSPRAIATFLQRVGRANHTAAGVPAGRLFPLTRDELVECTALLSAVRAGELDTLRPPVAPLDVLAQQLVAEVSAGECSVDALFALVTRAAPYADLDRPRFDEVVELVSEGIATGRGRRGAHLHHDGINGRLRPRRGARLAALTSGGAIPETGEYRVVLDPEGATVGSVHEDFAVEATIGDVFLLGTHSWRVCKVELGVVRVTDAGDAPPSVPFWLGEAPSRTAELSAGVGALRALVERHLDSPTAPGGSEGARAALRAAAGVSEEVATQVVAYLEAGRRVLGALPTTRRIVIERFFDEVEGMQIVVHAPYGGGVNRALGLALRKRFCVTFDFELQAAADDDTVTVALGPQHSFPLAEVATMVRSGSVTEVLTQAVLAHPMLQARWRWNCTRALVVPRARGGQRRPIHLQRMDAEDVMAATWPALAACQENAPAGPIAVPDHVLVRQTVHDCLHEALDVDGLVALLADLEHGRVSVHLVETTEPSPLAHGILSGKPYTYLDGAPLEERRSRAVPIRRGLDLLLDPAVDLGPLDPPAVAQVLGALRPSPRDPDELHDLLLSLGRCRPVPAWAGLFSALVASGRAVALPAEALSGPGLTPDLENGAGDGGACDRGEGTVECDWVAAERLDRADVRGDDAVASAVVSGHLDCCGPVSVAQLVDRGELPCGTLRGAPMSESRARVALARLETAGSAVATPDGRWCARHLLVRLHAASRSRRRRGVEPVPIADLVRFLGRWHHVEPGFQLEGRAGVLAAVELLQGWHAPADEWERSVLPARVLGYQAAWLDELCLAGDVAWGRLAPRDGGPGGAGDARRRGAATPTPSTPLSLVLRTDLEWMLGAIRGDSAPPAPLAGASADVLEVLAARGACFRAELAPLSGRLPVEVDEGLWDLVARGIATADAFSAVRALLAARARGRSRRPGASALRGGIGRRRSPVGSGVGEGRWSLLSARGDPTDPDAMAELVAGQLLVRWGIVAWELWRTEDFRLPWRDVVRALRRLEARGQVLGGRFVAGLAGEQFALPGAVEMLAEVRRQPSGRCLEIAAVDPLNVTGTVLPGSRVPAQRGRALTLRDGVPMAG